MDGQIVVAFTAEQAEWLRESLASLAKMARGAGEEVEAAMAADVLDQIEQSIYESL